MIYRTCCCAQKRLAKEAGQKSFFEDPNNFVHEEMTCFINKKCIINYLLFIGYK